LEGLYISLLFALPAGKEGEPALLDVKALAAAVQKRAPLYDKAQEGHYNLISALHKSLRGSDTDAALYWLARMLVGGEDPLSSRGVWFGSRSRMSAWPIRRGWCRRWRLGHLRTARLARGRAGAGAMRDLPRHGPKSNAAYTA